jgi:hypothetical protein
MMKKACYILAIFFFQNMFSQVGVGTTNPQQKLHIASPTGTLRVESLNYLNNSYNGGDSDNDGDYTNNTYPLFVDDNGDFTLQFVPIINSGNVDAFDNAVLPNSSMTLLVNDTDGEMNQIIDSYTVVVNRPSVLELKYNISYNVYLNPGLTIINDGMARRVDTFVTVTGQTRRYGATSRCYSSTSFNSFTGPYYSSSTTFITLPSAGSYDINIHGGISTDISSATGNPDPALATHVEFATENDFIFARLH